MTRLTRLAGILRPVAPAILGLWLLQAVFGAWLAQPLFEAGAPLEDLELFEPGALMLSELVLTQRDQLLSALRQTAPRGLTALVVLALARYQVMRLIARQAHLGADWPNWWTGAAWTLGLSIAQTLLFIGSATGAAWTTMRLERAAQGTVPSSLLISMTLLALCLGAVLLVLSVVTHLAQFQFISQPRATLAVRELRKTLRRHLFPLTLGKASCSLATSCLALGASLAAAPASGQGQNPWLIGIGVQLLLLLSLALKTAWLAFAAQCAAPAQTQRS